MRLGHRVPGGALPCGFYGASFAGRFAQARNRVSGRRRGQLAFGPTGRVPGPVREVRPLLRTRAPGRGSAAAVGDDPKEGGRRRPRPLVVSDDELDQLAAAAAGRPGAAFGADGSRAPAPSLDEVSNGSVGDAMTMTDEHRRGFGGALGERSEVTLAR